MALQEAVLCDDKASGVFLPPFFNRLRGALAQRRHELELEGYVVFWIRPRLVFVYALRAVDCKHFIARFLHEQCVGGGVHRLVWVRGFRVELAAAQKCAAINYREFVEAIQANDPARCGSRLSYAAPLTEALLIGCIALRYPGEELHFDPKTLQFTNKPEANAFLKAPKRGDWDFAKLMRK